MDRNILADPLDGQYWTPTPYKFGTRAMKYMVKPCTPVPDPSTKPMKSKDFLRENLISHLRQSEDICMGFWVQLETDPSLTDKATVKWSEEGSGIFRLFATIVIKPGQNVDDENRKKTCENL